MSGAASASDRKASTSTTGRTSTGQSGGDGTSAGTPGDSDKGLVAHSVFDFLMIELVPMAQRISNELYERELIATGVLPESLAEESPPPPPPKKGKRGAKQPIDDEKKRPKLDDTELREATFYRLEALGYRVGQGVMESLSASAPLISPLTYAPPNPATGAPPPVNHLDTIKYLCKDFWTAVFRKQIDNLKTNHRGVFVLTDNRFEPLRRCSLPSAPSHGGPGGVEEATRRASLFLSFPTGLVRGALAGLGVDAVVSAEVAGVGLPGVTFQIRTGVAVSTGQVSGEMTSTTKLTLTVEIRYFPKLVWLGLRRTTRRSRHLRPALFTNDDEQHARI